MALYLCSKFCIFDRPILEEYVFHVEGGSHLLQFCLHVVQNCLPLAIRDMHLSFKNLAITSAPSLQTSLMEIHHDTSFRSILEDDSISLASKACIHFCLGKGIGLWLVVGSFIYSFQIAHSIFTSTLHFCFGLI